MPREGEIGALWEKIGPNGPYLTGRINDEPVVVFRNVQKQGNQPDWRVMKPKPRVAPADGRKPAAKSETHLRTEDDDLDTAF